MVRHGTLVPPLRFTPLCSFATGSLRTSVARSGLQRPRQQGMPLGFARPRLFGWLHLASRFSYCRGVCGAGSSCRSSLRSTQIPTSGTWQSTTHDHARTRAQRPVECGPPVRGPRPQEGRAGNGPDPASGDQSLRKELVRRRRNL